MKNEIAIQLEAGYADLRKSEKQAADYILEYMERVPDLSLDRLAQEAGVSQPTVLRMLKALGYDGYREFRYRLVAELAKAEKKEDTGGKDQLMYGYTLEEDTRLDDIPFYRHLQRGEFGSRCGGPDDEAVLPRSAVPVFYGLLSAADYGGEADGAGCGGGHFLFRRIQGHGGCPESGDACRGDDRCYHKFPQVAYQPARGHPHLHQPGAAFLWKCHFLTGVPDSDCGYDIHGTDFFGLRTLCGTTEQMREGGA